MLRKERSVAGLRFRDVLTVK